MFKEAMSRNFVSYQRQIVKNARALAAALEGAGYRIVSGGTDTHLMLVDLSEKGITGNEASQVLEQAGITVNKNLIPFDKKSPMVTSGIRLGTAALTTRRMKEPQMRQIARLIDTAIGHREELSAIRDVRRRVRELAGRFPLYPQLARA